MNDRRALSTAIREISSYLLKRYVERNVKKYPFLDRRGKKKGKLIMGTKWFKLAFPDQGVHEIEWNWETEEVRAKFCSYFEWQYGKKCDNEDDALIEGERIVKEQRK